MVRFREIRCWPRKSAAHTLWVTTKNRLNDKFLTDSQAYAHLRALDPELPDHVWHVIIRYRPQLSALQWDAVREFTIVNAIRIKPRTFETVRRLMTILRRSSSILRMTASTSRPITFSTQ